MSFAIFFYLKKNKKSQKNEVPVYCRISTSSKDRVEYYTKIKIDEKLWLSRPKRAANGMTEYIKGSTEKVKNYNKTLNLIESKIQQKYNNLMEEEAIITASELKDSLVNLGNINQNTILHFLNKLRDKREKQSSKAVLKTYINKVKLFLKQEYNVEDIPIKALLQKKYLGFGAKLTEWGQQKQGWSKIYTKEVLTTIKAAVNIAVDLHYIEYNPIRYKIKLKKHDLKHKETLSFTEIKLLEEATFSRKSLTRSRDVFLFQIYTGLAHIDVLTLRSKYINKGSDGRNWIIKKRQKTLSIAKIPLIDKAQALLDKYDFLEDKILPVIHLVAYNRNLKEIMSILNIEKNISSHCARHTFATLMRESGSDLSNLKQIVAHSRTSMTEHYAQLTPHTLAEEMDKLEEKLGA